jgi:hypothetical protein
MPFPKPVQGLVIRYSYQWRTEHQRGREEGSKDRPCAVILATTQEDGRVIVSVLPITHMPPAEPAFAVEIPSATKRRLGLNSERSWVVLTEANRFVWPGPDLRPTPGDDSGNIAYGLLPYALTEEIRLKFLSLLKARRAQMVRRTE